MSEGLRDIKNMVRLQQPLQRPTSQASTSLPSRPIVLYSNCVKQGLSIELVSDVSSIKPSENPMSGDVNGIDQRYMHEDKLKKANKPNRTDREEDRQQNLQSKVGRRTSQQWQVVWSRRKTEVITGMKKVDGEFRGAKRVSSLYIGRCDKSVGLDDIQKYVSHELKIPIVSCSQLSGANSEVKSFNIVVDVEHFDKLLIPTIWPENVIVHKYFYRRNRGTTNI